MPQPDNTIDSTSPPYPTYRTASNALHQLAMLSTATTDYPIGHKTTIEPTSTTCPCPLAGWPCRHNQVKPPEANPPNRGRGISL